MVEFLAKVAQLEEISLLELYGKLVEMGFKLSQEDVSGSHERLRDDHTIIEQMRLLFSLCNISKKNRLFEQGMLEIERNGTAQKYWMHSVIAAAILESASPELISIVSAYKNQ